MSGVVWNNLRSKRSQTPYRDGTTQVAFDPVDFIARLAALVPKPRVNLTRYDGVLGSPLFSDAIR
jgi:hypothetical protein